MWWKNRRQIERIEDRLDALEWGSGLPREGGGLEALREEIQAQGKTQRDQTTQLVDQTTQLVEILKPKQPQAPTLKSLLVSDWLAGLRGLPGWGFRFVSEHWQWCLGVPGATIALWIPLDANRLQREANVLSRDTLKALSVQIERQDEQIMKQDADTRIVRRAQLLSTIYEPAGCDLTEKLAAWEERKRKVEETKARFLVGKPQCDPKAPLRLREEAVLALARIDGQELDLSNADLRGADLRGADLSNSTLRSTDLRGADLSNSTLRHVDLSNADLRGANLLRAKLSNSTLRGAKLSNAYLVAAKLSNADLLGVDLIGANLRYANLRYADLSHADLSHVNLLRADVSNADLRNTKLRYARNLIQEQLNITCGDSETEIPERLERPGHWIGQPAEVLAIQRKGCPP